MTKDKMLKLFSFLEADKEISQKEEKEFEESLQEVQTRFAMPVFLKQYDWLPKHKREASDNDIAKVLSSNDKSTLYHWSWCSQTKDLVITYYEKKSKYYQVVLYDCSTNMPRMSVVMTMKDQLSKSVS